MVLYDAFMSLCLGRHWFGITDLGFRGVQEYAFGVFIGMLGSSDWSTMLYPYTTLFVHSVVHSVWFLLMHALLSRHSTRT
jgi:hypothetical protein